MAPLPVVPRGKGLSKYYFPLWPVSDRANGGTYSLSLFLGIAPGAIGFAGPQAYPYHDTYQSECKQQ
jgi:hypothetical protein